MKIRVFLIAIAFLPIFSASAGDKTIATLEGLGFSTRVSRVDKGYVLKSKGKQTVWLSVGQGEELERKLLEWILRQESAQASSQVSRVRACKKRLLVKLTRTKEQGSACIDDARGLSIAREIVDSALSVGKILR